MSPSPLAAYSGSDENQSWSIGIVCVVCMVAYAIFKNCFHRNSTVPLPISQPIKPPVSKPISLPLPVAICNWQSSDEKLSLTVFRNSNNKFCYTLRDGIFEDKDDHLFPYGAPRRLLDEGDINVDESLPIEESTSRLQGMIPVFKDGKLESFVEGIKRYNGGAFENIILVGKIQLQWKIFRDQLSQSTELGPDEYAPREWNKGYLSQIQISEGIFDLDTPYATDYSKFADPEFYASDSGRNLLQMELPELCESYWNKKRTDEENFAEIKNILVRFREAIGQAKNDNERRVAFETYIPVQARIKSLEDFSMRVSKDEPPQISRLKEDGRSQLDRTDYSEFADPVYYASVSGTNLLQIRLPELCKFYENNFAEIKNTLVRFREAIRQAKNNNDRRVAYETYIPLQARIKNLDYFELYEMHVSHNQTRQISLRKRTRQSQLDPNIELDRDNWAITLINTDGRCDLKSPMSKFGHAVIVIEGLRKGISCVWTSDLGLRDGVRAPTKVFIEEIEIQGKPKVRIREPEGKTGVAIVGRSRTWKVLRHGDTDRRGVTEIFKEILEDKRTLRVKWGYLFGTHNCTTWAITKLNLLLHPRDRIKVYLSIAEMFLYHGAPIFPELSEEQKFWKKWQSVHPDE